MNKILTILFAGFCLAYTLPASAVSNDKTTVYVFGFSASFNDSTVYFTDIQQLDGVYVGRKTHFLTDRDLYAAQLRDFLSERGEPNRVCVISFAEKRKDVEKKIVQLKKKYLKDGIYDVKYLAANEFQFQLIDSEEPAQEPTKAEKKKEKKAKEKEQGDKPRGGKGGKPHGGHNGAPRP